MQRHGLSRTDNRPHFSCYFRRNCTRNLIEFTENVTCINCNPRTQLSRFFDSGNLPQQNRELLVLFYQEDHLHLGVRTVFWSGDRHRTVGAGELRRLVDWGVASAVCRDVLVYFHDRDFE